MQSNIIRPSRRLTQQLDLLPRLKSRHPNERTARTPERIPKTTTPTTTRLSLHCEIKLICPQGDDGQLSGRCVFHLLQLLETAGAVLAGLSAFSGRGGAFGGLDDGLCEVFWLEEGGFVDYVGGIKVEEVEAFLGG